MAPTRISRAGLVKCPSCHSHIYVEEQVEDTVCPFCKVGLRVGQIDAGGGLFAALRQHAGKAGGLLATAFVGIAAGCATETAAPVYGMPADMIDVGSTGQGKDAGSTTDVGAQGADVATGADAADNADASSGK